MDHADTRDADAGAWPAQRHVTALYEAHALSLARLALVMLGDPAAAEDVVQDAFLGLYRRWDSLAGAPVALAYLRTSVLNGCRTAARRQSRFGVLADVRRHDGAQALESAEATVLLGEEHRAVLAAIRSGTKGARRNLRRASACSSMASSPACCRPCPAISSGTPIPSPGSAAEAGQESRRRQATSAARGRF